MMNWIRDKVFAWMGGKLSGYKTYIAGAGFILLALAGCAGKLFPDQGLPEMDWDTIGGQFSGGMALWGVGHKLEKIATTTLPSPGDTTGING